MPYCIKDSGGSLYFWAIRIMATDCIDDYMEKRDGEWSDYQSKGVSVVPVTVKEVVK